MLHLRTDWSGVQDTAQAVNLGGECHELNECCECCVQVDAEGNSVWPEASSTILPDEPVFMVRAKDALAAQIVADYASLARAAGADKRMCDRLERFAQEMVDYGAARRADGTWGPAHVPDAPALLP